MKKEINLGDRVAFSVHFLRAVSCFTGPIPQARGIVDSVKLVGSSRICSVDWGGNAHEVPREVNAKNLVLGDEIFRELV